jgi:hypothetical protein
MTTTTIPNELPPPQPCGTRGRYLELQVVNLGEKDSKRKVGGHTLSVCSGGVELERYDMGISPKGFDKTRWGDNKTPPPGEYALDAPRDSGDGFGKFIKIGWHPKKGPPESKKPVGIHGPKKSFDGFGDRDWTQGCPSTETRADIFELAKLVEKLNIRLLKIVEKPKRVDEATTAQVATGLATPEQLAPNPVSAKTATPPIKRRTF